MERQRTIWELELRSLRLEAEAHWRAWVGDGEGRRQTFWCKPELFEKLLHGIRYLEQQSAAASSLTGRNNDYDDGDLDEPDVPADLPWREEGGVLRDASGSGVGISKITAQRIARAVNARYGAAASSLNGIPDGCQYNPFVSRICERGTSGCKIRHSSLNGETREQIMREAMERHERALGVVRAIDAIVNAEPFADVDSIAVTDIVEHALKAEYSRAQRSGQSATERERP